MRKICVAHLVRACNGIEAFSSFIRSYESNTAGIEHDLVIIFKGFDNNADLSPYQDLLSSFSYEKLFSPDEGLDIGNYLVTAKQLKQDYVCFLNSFSLILEPGWLEMLYRQINREAVGVVGATGSWESHYNNHINALRTATEASSIDGKTLISIPRRLIGRPLMRRYVLAKLHREFIPFPNYHLRTNAFLISRPLLLSLKHKKIQSKSDALSFESGRHGWTQQILSRKLRPLVVGRDGQAYEKEDWAQSQTFRSGDQQNLLVADNQTQRYQRAGAEERRALSEFSWGQ